MAARTPALEDQPWDGRPIDAALTWREPAEPLRVAVVGDSVPASLLSGWDPGRYRGLEVLRYAEYGGCSATPVTMQVLDRQVPESPVCPSWRQLWPREVREKGADVVLAPAGLRFVLPTVVDGKVVPPRSEQLRGFVEADLNAMREQTERSGAAQLDILNVPGRVLDGSSQPRQQLEQIRTQLGITDGELVLDPTWVNGVIDDWAARQGDDGRGSPCSTSMPSCAPAGATSGSSAGRCCTRRACTSPPRVRAPCGPGSPRPSSRRPASAERAPGMMWDEIDPPPPARAQWGRPPMEAR